MAEVLENRRHARLKRLVDVNWAIEGQISHGEGTVVNISQSGVLLVTDRVFKPTDKCLVSIVPFEQDQGLFNPKKGKLVWLRRVLLPQPRFQCGIEFLSTQRMDLRFNRWLEEEMLKLGDAANVNILRNYLA